MRLEVYITVNILFILLKLAVPSPEGEYGGLRNRKSIKDLIGEVDIVEKELLEVSEKVARAEKQGIKGLRNKRRNRVRVKRPVQKDCETEFDAQLWV